MLGLDVDYPFETSKEYPHQARLTPEDGEARCTPEDQSSPKSTGEADSLSAAGSMTLTSISEGTTRVDIAPPEVYVRPNCKRQIEVSSWKVSTIPVLTGAATN
jgi:hypothetical protein